MIVYGDQELFFEKETSTREPPITKQGRNVPILVPKSVLYFELITTENVIFYLP